MVVVGLMELADAIGPFGVPQLQIHRHEHLREALGHIHLMFEHATGEPIQQLALQLALEQKLAQELAQELAPAPRPRTPAPPPRSARP